MNIKNKVSEISGNVKKHWKTAPNGRYMNYKEIVSLSVGGIGVRLIIYIIDQLIITSNNAIMGNTIGIEPVNLYIIYIIGLLSGIPLTGLRAYIIDNTKSRKGKYRPYLISMGIPTVILGILFMIMPYESMNQLGKCATVLAFNIAFQFFYNMFNESYTSLIYVLSPNSTERLDVMSIKNIVENLSPSIVSILFPLIVLWVTGQNEIYNLKAYRFAFPPLLFLGMLLTILVYVNTEEKIIQPKSHFIKIRFADAFRAVANNKYFWIISLAGWLGFLEGAFANIINWMYNYQNACQAWQFSIIIAVTGNASLWPNIVGPFLIRRWGKKKILVFSNLLNIIFIAMMLPIVRQTGKPNIIWILMAIIFINQFLTSLGHLLSPAVTADIRDYQQYISGERIDGMFSAVGIIGNIITMATGLVLPVIYERSGLNKGTAVRLGFDGSNVYDVLYNKELFISICSILIIASVIGAAMNVIPFFFYDLTETKQKSYMKVLKIRAYFEDKKADITDDERKNEIEEIISEAVNLADKKAVDISSLKGKEKSDARKLNEKIQEAKFVLDEIRYYTTSNGMKELEYAKAILKSGISSFNNSVKAGKEDYKNLPNKTAYEKRFRRYMKNMYISLKASQRAKEKHFNNKDFTGFDEHKMLNLYEEDDALQLKINNNLKAQKSARTAKDKIRLAALENELKKIRNEKNVLKAEIKKVQKEQSIYHECVKPYIDAERTVLLAEAYSKCGYSL